MWLDEGDAAPLFTAFNRVRLRNAAVRRAMSVSDPSGPEIADEAEPGVAAPDAAEIARLRALHPADIAERLRPLPVVRLRAILRELPDELTAEVIAELPAEQQVALFESMRLQRLSGIVSEMFSDDAADILGNLSSARLREVMAALDPSEAEEMGDLLRFPEDTAGGRMQTEFVAVPEGATIGEAIEQLRSAEDQTSQGTFYVYAVDAHRRLKGVLRIRDLLFRRPELRIGEVMVPEVRAVSVHADQEELARLFRDYGFTALPVVDDFQRLRGVVTADDVMQVVEEEATEDMHRMVGLTGEEGAHTPWSEAVRSRLPWLMFNLGTAFLAGWVVSLFESTIERAAVLAVFLPIIAGQAGNSGTQTLTILVRSLAVGGLDPGEGRKVLRKELAVGLVNGLAIGCVVGFASWLWKGLPVLGVLTFAAMVLNMAVAALTGVLIPLGLKALRVDPALASAILLTTFTDCAGFFIFLGLATLALRYFPVL
jgi:magnesium transporter